MAQKDKDSWRTIQIPAVSGEEKQAILDKAGLPKDVPATKLPNSVKASIRVLNGQNKDRVFELTQVYSVVGRREDCEIRLDEGSISGRHTAVYYTVGKDWRAEDLASTNGTKLNGSPMLEFALKPNDKIKVGKIELEFLVG